MTTIDWLRFYADYLTAKAGVRLGDDRGLTTAEVAAISVLLLGGAILVVGIIVNAATNNANNIPDPMAP